MDFTRIMGDKMIGKYKVVNLQDRTYQVKFCPEEGAGGCPYTCQCRIEHQGSLSDCEAYIRLNEGGYM